MKAHRTVLATMAMCLMPMVCAADDGTQNVYVVGSEPLTNFSEKMETLVLNVACSMGFQPPDGSDLTCPDNNSYYYDPFNNNEFLSGMIYTQLLSMPFSLSYSNLYQTSSEYDTTVEALSAPSIYLDYWDPASGLESLTNYIFTYNDSDSYWWLNTLSSTYFDMGFYSNSDYNSTTLDSDFTKYYAVSTSNQEQYLGTPTALAVLNMSMLPYVCINSTDANCMLNTIFPFVQLAAVDTVANINSGETISDADKPYASLSYLETELPQAYSHLQALASLNFDTLMSPIMYNTNVLTTPEESADSQYTLNSPGSNELEAATTFVKHVTGQFIPPPPIDDSDWDDADVATVYTYMAQLRTFAAQLSVPISNLNFLLAQRIQPTQDDEPKISQAAYEYNMATRRLQTIKDTSDDSDSSKTPVSWLQKVRVMSPNQQSAEQLQLLAEINYQLYLQRKLLERLLATESTVAAGSISTMKSQISLTNAASLMSLLTTGSENTDDDDSSDSSD